MCLKPLFRFAKTHLCGCLEGGWGCTHSPVLHAGVCTCTRRWSRGSLQVYIFLREFLWRMCMPAGVYTWPVYVCERAQWCMNACPAVCEFVCVITSACHYGEVYVRERAHNKSLPLAHKNPRTAFPPVPFAFPILFVIIPRVPLLSSFIPTSHSPLRLHSLLGSSLFDV